MITTAYLADHAEAIPTLAQWFRAQWPDYYAHQTQTDVERQFHREASRDRLPSRLVAFEAGELAGTIVLRELALETLPEFRPGLGGLYVVGSRRGRGVGTELVRAGMEAARAQDCEVVYATTATAGGILVRLGWVQVTAVHHEGEQLGVYRCELQPPGATVMQEKRDESS